MTFRHDCKGSSMLRVSAATMFGEFKAHQGWERSPGTTSRSASQSCTCTTRLHPRADSQTWRRRTSKILRTRVSHLRVPLSATMPPGRLPPILLHWICRPRPPSPSTSQTTCGSPQWSNSSSPWWSTSSTWWSTSPSWWSSAFPSWWSTFSSWWSPPCGCRPDNHSRLAWSISLACLGSLLLLRRRCPSPNQAPWPTCWLKWVEEPD